MAEPILSNPLSQINAAWQQGRTNAFNTAEGQALTTTGATQQAALNQAAQLDPSGSLDMTKQNQQVNGQKLVNMARLLINAPDSQKDAIYQSMKPTLGQLGIDPSTLPATYDDTVKQTAQSLVTAYTPTNQIPAAVRTDMYRNQGLSDADIQQKRRIQAGLDPRATNPNYTQVEVPDGQGGKILAFYNHKTGKPELPDYSALNGTEAAVTGTGWAQAPTALTPASTSPSGAPIVAPSTPGTTLPNQNDAMLPLIQSANARVAAGEDPDVVQRDLLAHKAQVDAQAAAASAPTSTAATNLSAPTPSTNLGLGRTPAKKDTNEIAKRKENLQQFASAGITLSPDEQKQYLLDGKPPADLTGPKSLNDDQEKIAQSLANYRLSPGARFFGDAKNQPVIARAMDINTNFDQGQYQQSHKLLNDLASNSPTSIGGGIVSANTALDHLQALSDLSQKLPDHLSSISGAVTDAAGRLSSTTLGDNLKAWDNDAGLMAAEVQKMIKSGVATEGETDRMLAGLSPDAPKSQRDTALAQLASFMNDKVAQQENRRDLVLGDNSPGTSFLNAAAQDKLRTILQRGNAKVPDLLPPSKTLGMGVRPIAAPQQITPASTTPPGIQALLDKYSGTK